MPEATVRTTAAPEPAVRVVPRAAARSAEHADGELANLQRMAATSPATRRLDRLQRLAAGPAQRVPTEEEDAFQMVSDLAALQRNGSAPVATAGAAEVLQGRFTTQVTLLNNPPAPMARPQLRAWILANCSANVKALVTRPDVLLTVNWNDGHGDHGETIMELHYTDAGGNAGQFDLFDGAGVDNVNALNLPLQTYEIRVMVIIRSGGDLIGHAPVGANVQSTWQGTLAHELEVHTGPAKRVYDNLAAMNRPKTDLESKRKKITNTIETRDGEAEHKQLASGNSAINDAYASAVATAPRNQKINILLDCAWDRMDHAEDYLTKAHELKLAYRNIKMWMNETVRGIANLTGPELDRINALKTQLDTRLAAL